MAKKEKKQQKAKQNKSGNTGAFALLILTGLGACTVFFMPTAILLLIGMMPSIVAVISDGSREKLAGITVGLLNFAGVMPYLLKLWSEEHSMAYALDIIMNMTSLIVMYLAAGLGWLLYLQLPLVTAKISLKRSKASLASAKKEIDLLKEKWGEAL